MLIICKNCKKLIDTDKHDFCPKCGSNFNYGENLTAITHTEDYEEYERNRAEQQRAEVENRMKQKPKKQSNTQRETQRRLQNQADKAQGKKNGCAGCVGAIVIAIFGFGVLSGIIEESDFDIDEFLNEEFGTAEETTAYTAPVISFDVPDYVDIESTDYDYTYPQTVLPRETAYTDKYSFTCTEIAEYENEFFKPDEGYKYLSFTFKLENTTDSTRFYYESPTCTADAEEATMAAFGGLFIPGQLEPGEVYESTVVFQMPEHALFYDIYYGDDVIIYASISDIEGYENFWEELEEQ